jgi:hypothetical protein
MTAERTLSAIEALLADENQMAAGQERHEFTGMKMQHETACWRCDAAADPDSKVGLCQPCTLFLRDEPAQVRSAGPRVRPAYMLADDQRSTLARAWEAVQRWCREVATLVTATVDALTNVWLGISYDENGVRVLAPIPVDRLRAPAEWAARLVWNLRPVSR